MKSIIFILATSIVILTGCKSTTVTEDATPKNGYVTPKGINVVPSL
jgi:uncharacterized lipoprotein YajG